MDNDSRGLLFFILGFLCIWLVFDQFYGKKYINNLIEMLTPSIPGMITPPKWIDQQQAQQSKDKAKQAVDKDTKLNQQEKDYMKQNIDHFYGPGPA